MSAGDEKTFTGTLAGGERAGEEAEITVTVQSVKVKNLPDLDDEFAQLASEFDTIEELRDDVRVRLGRQVKMQQLSQARDKALEALIEKIDIPLPDRVVEEEISRRNQQLEQQLQMAGMTKEQYLSDEEKTEEEFDAEVADAARLAVKGGFVLDQLAVQEELNVENEELSEYVVSQAMQMGVQPQQLADYLDREQPAPGDRRREVLRNKALNLVVEHATVKDESGNVIDVDAVQRELSGETVRAEDGDERRAAGTPPTPGRRPRRRPEPLRAPLRRPRPPRRRTRRARSLSRPDVLEAPSTAPHPNAGCGAVLSAWNGRGVGPDAVRRRRCRDCPGRPAAHGYAPGEKRPPGPKRPAERVNVQSSEPMKRTGGTRGEHASDFRRVVADPGAGRRGAPVAVWATSCSSGCCGSASSSSASRSTTTSPTASAPSCCCCRPRTAERDITLYINSPGGSVTAGMAIYDMMQYVPNDIATVGMGLAASMGQFLLCAGHAGQALRPAARADHDAPAVRRHRRHGLRHQDPGRADAATSSGRSPSDRRHTGQTSSRSSATPTATAGSPPRRPRTTASSTTWCTAPTRCPPRAPCPDDLFVSEARS